MGKRKRENGEEDTPKSSKKIKKEKRDDEEEVKVEFNLPDEIYNDEIDGYSLNSSDERYIEKDISTFRSPHPIKDKKRKSVTFGESVVFPIQSDDNSDSSLISNGSFEKSRSEKKLSKNNINGGQESDFLYYLIRKPIDVTMQDLESIQLPRDLSESRKIKLKKDNCTYTMRPEELQSPMAYFPSKNILTVKDSSKIKCNGLISAHCVLAPVQKKVAGPQIYDEGEDIPEDAPLDFEISSIRKVPKVDWDSKEQRLHAFGIKLKKKSKLHKKY